VIVHCDNTLLRIHHCDNTLYKPLVSHRIEEIQDHSKVVGYQLSISENPVEVAGETCPAKPGGGTDLSAWLADK